MVKYNAVVKSLIVSPVFLLFKKLAYKSALKSFPFTIAFDSEVNTYSGLLVPVLRWEFTCQDISRNMNHIFNQFDLGCNKNVRELSILDCTLWIYIYMSKYETTLCSFFLVIRVVVVAVASSLTLSQFIYSFFYKINSSILIICK